MIDAQADAVYLYHLHVVHTAAAKIMVVVKAQRFPVQTSLSTRWYIIM